MKVAVCVDHNEPSKLAIKEALELVDMTGSELTLLHSVQDQVSDTEQVVKGNTSDEMRSRGNGILQSYMDYIDDMNYDIKVNKELIISDDSSVESISNYLDQNNYDHVYIGHRALDKEKEKLYGSFAKKMIRYANIPVTIVS